MGDIADAMINGDMSWDGEWLGDGEGYERNADGSPRWQHKGSQKSLACPVCGKAFKFRKHRRQHLGDKHKMRYGENNALVSIPTRPDEAPHG